MIHVPLEVLRHHEGLFAAFVATGVRFEDSGHTRHEAASRFDVSVAFVVKLVAAWRATGSYAHTSKAVTARR